MSDEERERLLDLLNLKDEYIAQLEDALRFYADLNNWYEDSHEGDSWEGVWWRGVHYGRGWQLARDALSSSSSGLRAEDEEKPWPRYPLFNSEAGATPSEPPQEKEE